MDNIRQTYTTRKLMQEQELASYITDTQRKQFADAGTLQTNSLKALQRALETDYTVERSRGKWTLTKRSEGSLPPFMLDERLTRGKTDTQLLILTRFSNYIAQLQHDLADSETDKKMVSKTINNWLVDAELINAGITNMYQHSQAISQLDNQINHFYGHYSNQLNYQLRQFFFSQINSKALDLKLKQVAMISLIELDETGQLQTLQLDDSELELIDSYRQKLMSDSKYSTQFYRRKQLNDAGRYELNQYVTNKFECSKWWYEYEIDLNQLNQRATLDEQVDSTQLIRDAFRAYRTEQVIKQEYERPYYILDETLKLAMIEQRYYSLTNQADALLDIAETDDERISELRQRYSDELSSIVLDRHSTDVFRLSDETIEAHEAGFLDINSFKIAYLSYYAKADTKQMLE